jgi:hypothetical protein
MKSSDGLKFLLVLLGCANYRSLLSDSHFARFKNKKAICQELRKRELVDFSQEIVTVKILSQGAALLKLDTAELPISPIEFKVLEKVASASREISPTEIQGKGLKSVKADEKQTILNSLSDRGFIKAEKQVKRLKAEVWLTQQGIEYLRDDYAPKGKETIQFDLLNNYLHFLRKALRFRPYQETAMPPITEPSAQTNIYLSDKEILQMIQDLDRELGTKNYLPIFYLRQKLEPPLSRDEFDQAIYRLWGQDKIEVSSLVEAIHYSPEQIQAGIPQDSGGPLFFLIANE